MHPHPTNNNLNPQINYGANKGKAYTEEEDRFIVCSIAKHGYAAWDELKADIRGHWRFRCVEVGRVCQKLYVCQ
jgi:hypothetical protein